MNLSALLKCSRDPNFSNTTGFDTKKWFAHYNQIIRPLSRNSNTAEPDTKQDLAQNSIDRAIYSGRSTTRAGWAFMGGYQSAIEHLFAAHINPDQPELASFCVSEQGGNHPRAIQALLTENEDSTQLSGMKSFVSGAEDAQRLFVACKQGNDTQGLPQLKIASIRSSANGVSIKALPPLAFIPEVSHGQVVLDAAEPDEVLAGDGYLEFIKPFRTCEDIHVISAILAYLLGEGIEGQWPEALIEQMLAALMSYRALASMDYKDGGCHLALAGARQTMSELLEQVNPVFEQSNPAAFALWQRDQALLKIAYKAHLSRTEKAWAQLRTT